MGEQFPRWLRGYIAFVAMLAAAIGISLFVAPTSSAAATFFPVEVSPLNARVIGALYIGGLVGLGTALFARRAADTRLMVIGAGLISTLLLIMTFAYWDEFTTDHTPYGWIAVYVADSLVALLAIVRLHLIRPAVAGIHRLSGVMLAEAIASGGLGGVLLVAPNFAVDHWPWKLTPLLARVYASFFLAFGIAALLAVWEARPSAVRPLLAGSAALAICVIVASLRHLDRFRHGTPEDAWFIAFLVAAVVLVGAFLYSIRDALDRRDRTASNASTSLAS
jgi:hypothetical protein